MASSNSSTQELLNRILQQHLKQVETLVSTSTQQIFQQLQNEEALSSSPTDEVVAHASDVANAAGCPPPRVVPLRERRRNNEYCPVADERYLNYEDARKALTKLAGLSESGREMILVNTYPRKKTGDYAMRFRCPFSRATGYVAQCPYTGYIYCSEDDVFTLGLPPSPHPPHEPLDPSKAREERKAKMDDVILDCLRKDANVDTTLRELERNGLIAAGVDSRTIKYIYNRRYVLKKALDPGVPRCVGDSTVELEEFCLNNSAIPPPEEPHKIFCITHKSTAASYYSYFTTRHLLEKGVGEVHSDGYELHLQAIMGGISSSNASELETSFKSAPDSDRLQSLGKWGNCEGIAGRSSQYLLCVVARLFAHHLHRNYHSSEHIEVG